MNNTEDRLKKFAALYDLAPAGYFILDCNGSISEVNLSAANMLGVERSGLADINLKTFISQESLPIFKGFLQKIFESGFRQSCEIKLAIPQNSNLFVLLMGIISEDGKQCFVNSIDITIQKQAQEVLKESENNYRLLSRNLPGTSVFLFDHNFRFILAEGSVHPEFGFTTVQIEGKTLWDILPAERAEQLASIYKNVLQGKSVENFVSNYKGSCYSVNIFPVKNSQGEIIAGMVVSQDITERKRVEEALKQSEQHYRLIFDNNLDAFLLTAPDGMIESVNPATCEMFGRTAEEICQLGRSGIIDITDPRLTHALEERSSTGKFYGELTGIRKDGTKFPIEISSTIFTDYNGHQRTSMIIHDISERKRKERLIQESEINARAIMESTDDVLILVNKEGILIDCNEAHAKRLNATREELLGRCIFELLPPELAKSRREAINKAISTRQCVHGEDYRFGFWIEYAVHPIFIEGKPVNKVAVFARDITERKIAEQTLIENEIRLKELNATKDKFYSIIAHDLKSPFNSILGFSNLLAEKVQEKNYPGIEEYTAILQKSAQQTMSLLLNLLQWSRSQTGRIEFSPEYVDIVNLINEVTELLNESAIQKSIIITKELPDIASVLADKDMISTILRNLISNAIKFTHPGGEIIVSAEQRSAEWIVSVRDNGIGIKKDVLGKLFRIDESHSTVGTNNEKGTGLGLFLCKEFVEKHGGKIWAESQVGKGSNFYFAIPTK